VPQGDRKVLVTSFVNNEVKAVQLSSPSAKIKASSVNCQKYHEDLPEPAKADCEKWISGDNNTYIVMGRDRPGSKHEGYGGKGFANCGMIDIVVGRMHPSPKRVFKYSSDETNSTVLVDPMLTPYKPLTQGLKVDEVPVTWATDAARIYISQMTDIDENFGIKTDERFRKPARMRSGIGIKADTVRIIGNESVKIVTNIDKSLDGINDVAEGHGIHLIAHNRVKEKTTWDKGSKGVLEGGAADLQPMVRGDNLRGCVMELLEESIKLASTMQGIAFQLSMTNYNLAFHLHAPYIPDPSMHVLWDENTITMGLDVMNAMTMKTIPSCAAHAKNFDKIGAKYLSPNNHNTFINSHYNKTN
jgi:hypothetical protein